MSTPTRVDLADEPSITIDGLVALHDIHDNDNLIVTLSPAQYRYVYGQLRYVGKRLNTGPTRDGRWRSITFEIAA